MADADERPADAAGVSLVLTTLADLDAAESLVLTLVEERLIACGNLLPGVRSVYRWEGEVTQEQEVLVVMKTASGTVARLFARIEELHPYSVPELIEIPPGHVGRPYRSWVLDSVKVGE